MESEANVKEALVWSGVQQIIAFVIIEINVVSEGPDKSELIGKGSRGLDSDFLGFLIKRTWLGVGEELDGIRAPSVADKASAEL